MPDKIWGIGFSMTDENRLDMSKWRGQNLLYSLISEMENAVEMAFAKELKNDAC